MADTPFNRLRGTTQFINVKMNGEAILLPDSGKSAIGTENLNGCSGIVILGTAIILSHVSPSNPPTARQEHHEQALARIDRLIDQNPALFPPATTVWGAYGTIEEEAMDEVVEQVERHFAKKGILIKRAFYEVADPSSRKTPGAGQLVVDVGETGTAVYLENRRLDFKSQPKRRAAQSVTTPRSTISSGSVPSIGGSSSTERGNLQANREQMGTEARSAKDAFARLVARGYTREQATQALVGTFRQSRPTTTQEEAIAAVMALLRYQG